MKLPLQAVKLQYVKAKLKENFLILSPYFQINNNDLKGRKLAK